MKWSVMEMLRIMMKMKARMMPGTEAMSEELLLVDTVASMLDHSQVHT